MRARLVRFLDWLAPALDTDRPRTRRGRVAKLLIGVLSRMPP